MKFKFASTAVLALVFLAPTTPAYGFVDINLNFVVSIDGLKDAARSVDALIGLVKDLSDTDPNKGRHC